MVEHSTHNSMIEGSNPVIESGKEHSSKESFWSFNIYDKRHTYINIYCYLCEWTTHYLPTNIRQDRKYLKTVNILTQEPVL